MSNKLKNLVKKEDGTILVLIVIVLPIILYVMLLGIDFSRTTGSYSQNQSAADASALAVSEYVMKGKIDRINEPGFENGQWKDWLPSGSEITAYARQVYINNISSEEDFIDSPDISKFEVTYDSSSNKVIVTSCAYSTNMSFRESVIGDDRQEVCYSSSASFDISNNLADVEIALSLDVTYSMEGNRMKKLYEAVNFILDKYINADNQNSIFFSIVPFAQYISISPYEAELIKGGINQPDDTKFYPVPFFSSANTNSRLPSLFWMGQQFLQFDPIAKNKKMGAKGLSYGALTDRLVPFQNIQPLTNNKALLKEIMDLLLNGVNKGKQIYNGVEYKKIVSGQTMGASGIVGAWLTLHPEWQGKWNKKSMIEDISNYPFFDRSMLPSKDGKSKYIIHITDGQDSKDHSVDNFEEQNITLIYQDVCSTIRENGIEIFMIFYGGAAGNRQKVCQPDPDKRFEKVAPNELAIVYEQIFDTITSEINSVKLVN